MGRSAVRSVDLEGRCLFRAPGRPRLRRTAPLFVLFAALLIVAGPAVASAQTSPSASPEAASSASPAVEAVGDPCVQIFAENCSGCHGTSGQGGFGPSLAPAGFASLVVPMVTEGGMQMPSFRDSLTEQQIQDVAKYVAASIADPVARTAVAADGGETYRLYCAGCHSATGRGGALTRGRNAPDISQYPAAEALAAMILGRGNMPAFAGNTLDVRQQAAVGLYVGVLVDQPSPGGRGLGYLGPVTEGAVSAIALLILIFLAVWLAWKSRTVAP